ncbi:hypothetical protein [Saccharothrix coeruleofusca]|uniref:Uncharacterized protein n=1 Tax=Saccharothrix coeruleofusca TaxID=33919 RepID=A0A918EGJ6_9PSEU|nr:hypothetical protein [Saccharothrix coeruleofusca]MBP2336848.1 hypothetical protein [Saccharothrix coeruleofusca]GGP82331.1 hypothetical protein GCM10010185_65610 [Saccharothrix coeruleofusca]
MIGAALAGGLALGTASPAYADCNSPLYPTLSKCNEARKTCVSSWTSPQQCYRVVYGNDSFARYQFLVKTRC